MKCNIGKTDRMLRLIAGVLVISAGAYFHSWWGAVGIVPLLTGMLRWCPAYLPFGLSTVK